jgi:hypothetical protein
MPQTATLSEIAETANRYEDCTQNLDQSIDRNAAMKYTATSVDVAFVKSAHFRTRQTQRSVSDYAIGLTLKYGDVFFQGTDRVYFLGRKRIPASIPPAQAELLDGTTVVLGMDNVLVTTYRNRDAHRSLRRRSNGCAMGGRGRTIYA